MSTSRALGDLNAGAGEFVPARRRFGALRRLLRRPTAAFAVVILSIFLLLAAFPEPFAPYGENEPTQAYFQSPNFKHLLGTDNLGRDVFSRVVYGARASFLVGVMAVLMGTLSGSLLGISTGYFGGRIDYFGQRIVDILMSLPGILMALVIAAGLGASLRNVALAIAVAILPTSARIVRGSTLAVVSMPFIEASRATGAGHLRVMFRHVLPNVAAPMLVIASVQLGFAIIAEASLSFLGLGVPLGTSTWGTMLSGSSLLYVQRAPWMGIAPGIVLMLVIMATNLFGDALRDTWDPRMRGR